MDRTLELSLIQGRCGSCGRPEHIRDCPKVAQPSCAYDHDGETALRPHQTEFCPILHKYCGVCQAVGHHERAHTDGPYRKTNLELRLRYFRFMATGAYTSLPYLVFHPEGYRSLSVSHWCSSYDGRRFRHAAISRNALGLGADEVARMEEKSARQREHQNWATDRAQQLEIIRQNILKADTGETVPMPRDFMNRRYQETAAADQKKKIEQESQREGLRASGPGTSNPPGVGSRDSREPSPETAPRLANAHTRTVKRRERRKRLRKARRNE
jgi:hypothetical protein